MEIGTYLTHLGHVFFFNLCFWSFELCMAIFDSSPLFFPQFRRRARLDKRYAFHLKFKGHAYIILIDIITIVNSTNLCGMNIDKLFLRRFKLSLSV